jgi:cytoskeletal protein CcmA (bactofilin family)
VVLGPKDRLTGRLYVEGDLRVAGTVDGALEVTGDLEIDGGGQVKGPVMARQKLVVGSSGSLVGDVRVARLEVRDGASFSGNVSMGKQAVEQPVPQEPTVQPSEAAEQEAKPGPIQPRGKRR